MKAARSLINALSAGGLTAALLMACAAAPPVAESRFQELGPNSYMVTVQAQTSADGKQRARDQAQAEAERYCSERGRRVQVTHLSSGGSEYLQGGAVEVNFGCADAAP